MKKIDLSKFKVKRERVSKVQSWQDYAIEVCKDFNLKGCYKLIIFRQAKKNLQYLKGKVENTKEKFGVKGLESKGRYLISLFRKTPPWKK